MIELALDMHMLPEQLRTLKKHNVRDYNKLIMVHNARKMGVRQIAAAQKVPARYNLEI